MQMPINDAGIELLERKEQFVDHAYPDPYSALGEALQHAGLWKKYLRAAFPLPPEMADLSGAPWTLGWGFTDNVRPGDTITRYDADQRLARNLAVQYVEPIKKLCKVEPNDNQLAALACLAWNIGMPSFTTSTVLKCHNRGDFIAASRAFDLFNKSKGRVSTGLTQRRREEGALYLTPTDGHIYAMPQQVEPETKVRNSPVVAGTTITAATATITVVAEASRGVRGIFDDIGVASWLPYIVVIVAIGSAGVVIWKKVIQRKGGWT